MAGDIVLRLECCVSPGLAAGRHPLQCCLFFFFFMTSSYLESPFLFMSSGTFIIEPFAVSVRVSPAKGHLGDINRWSDMQGNTRPADVEDPLYETQ